MRYQFGQRLLQGRPSDLRAQREQVLPVLSAALEAVDPYGAVERDLPREDEQLLVGERRYDLTGLRRLFVVGAGKAGAPMVRAVEAVLGDRISAGLVNVKRGHVEPTRIVQLQEAGHPIPDEAGVEGTRRIVELAQAAGPDDLVICLISGGGSALLQLPSEGISLADTQQLTQALLRAGATINELNTVRKHLSQVTGGGLARLAQPARVLSLILSDVVGNPLDVIASGPTVPDSSTFAEAIAILERYAVWADLPDSIRERLEAGRRGQLAETPKPGDPLFQNVHNVVVASNERAAQAALRVAQAQGFRALLLSTYVEGEAREIGKVFAALAREVSASGQPLPRPCCLVAGGETTVTVRGQGSGGRNQELALGAALKLAGLPDVLVVALATDGNDGPTDAAGAVADGTTLERAKALGLDPHAALAENDTYRFFDRLGDLLLTGPTNTNVNDLVFVFAF
jgi:glycerate 2-kinase